MKHEGGLKEQDLETTTWDWCPIRTPTVTVGTDLKAKTWTFLICEFLSYVWSRDLKANYISGFFLIDIFLIRKINRMPYCCYLYLIQITLYITFVSYTNNNLQMFNLQNCFSPANFSISGYNDR